MFSEEQIQKFQKVYKEEFGGEVSKDAIIHQGTHLINLVKITLKTNVNFNKD